MRQPINPAKGATHEDLAAVTVHGGRGHRAVRVAGRHVGRRGQLRVATPARSTARARCSPAPRCPGRGQARRHQPLRAPTRAGCPGKFVADVGKTQTFSNGFEVADNTPGAPQTVAVDERRSARSRRPATTRTPRPATRIRSRSITFINTSGQPVNVARRVGNGDGAISRRRQSDRDVDQHRRLEHVHVPHRARGQNAIIKGGVRQDGRGTPRRDLRRLRRRDPGPAVARGPAPLRVSGAGGR